ncbi:putative protein N(5)-glutamine methyltransferase [Actinoplanes sp. NPDC051861]|uniref:putative protein N(5)-glutamine methyltransferase n=1 Tax=Actinoplanes sp. NPDC051861 TaxID=3155170 RepID=UPI003415C5BB
MTTIDRLRAAGCVFAEEEAAVLHEAAPDDATLEALLQRRINGEPLEQVVGYADFCGVRVRLRPGVFVPRARSALLVRVATESCPDNGVVIDLCCGSGALGLALKNRRPGIDLHATDLDPAAAECARDNLGRNVYLGDLYEPLPERLRSRTDVILANVPYVATNHIPFLPAEARDHEPRTALDGGDDGLTVFRAVAEQATTWLVRGGLLLTEITEAQAGTALEIAHSNGLTATIATDDDLDARVIAARRPRRP